MVFLRAIRKVGSFMKQRLGLFFTLWGLALFKFFAEKPFRLFWGFWFLVMAYGLIDWLLRHVAISFS